MPDLASWLDLLAVEVHLRAGVASHDMTVCRVELLVLTPEDIGHDGIALAGPRITEREVEHRPQVLLELAGHRPVHRPVAAVVRPHGELVDDIGRRPSRIDHLEELDREDAGDVERSGDPQRGLGHRGGQAGVKIGGRPDRLGADAVGLDGLGDRPRRGLTGRAAGDDRGELAAEVDPLLQEDAVAQRPVRAHRGEPVGQVLGPLRQDDALAVIPAPGGLGDDRPADLPGEGNHIRAGASTRPARAADAEVGEPLAHDELVLGMDQGSRAGVQDRPGHSERLQDRTGDVLVVEGHHVAVPGEVEDGSQVVVRTDRRGRGDQGCAGGGRLGEDAQGHAELGGRADHHPGELPGADDPDDREAAGSAVRGGHDTAPRRTPTGRPRTAAKVHSLLRTKDSGVTTAMTMSCPQ